MRTLTTKIHGSLTAKQPSALRFARPIRGRGTWFAVKFSGRRHATGARSFSPAPRGLPPAFGRDGLVRALSELPAPVAGAVICALLALAGVALAAPFVIVRLRAHIGLMKSALNNMTQGLCMFDGAARLILCNERFIAMHRMRPEHARAGTPMRDLVAHRVEVGTLLGDPTPISNPA